MTQAHSTQLPAQPEAPPLNRVRCAHRRHTSERPCNGRLIDAPVGMVVVARPLSSLAKASGRHLVQVCWVCHRWSELVLST